MARCATCGGLLGPDAEWCGQCFAPVRPAADPRGSTPSADRSSIEPASSPNGAGATDPPPLSLREERPATSALSPTAALAAIPPDIQITLASAGAPRPSLSDRGKSIITGAIVAAAAGSDAMFFPYAKYMVVYGICVGAFSGAAIWRLWARRSVKAN
jgi:hypothetical protein